MSTSSSSNPLINNFDLPKFGEIRPEHIDEAVDFLLSNLENTIKTLEKVTDPTWNNLMVPLEKVSRLSTSIWGTVYHLNLVQNTDELRTAIEKNQKRIVELSLSLQQNEKIYQNYKKLLDSEESKGFNAAKKRILEKAIKSAQKSGIELPTDSRKRFIEIEKSIKELKSKFSNNVLDSNKSSFLIIKDASDMAGLSSSYLKMTSDLYNKSQKDEKDFTPSNPENGPYKITLDAPVLIPFLEKAKSSEKRKELYYLHITRASSGKFDNSNVMMDILKLRKEKANLLGFKTYVDLTLDNYMASNIDNVRNLLGKIEKPAKTLSKKEFEELTNFAKSYDGKEKIENWDVKYYQNLLMENRYSYSEDDIKPYFPLSSVLNGLFEITQKLFGVTVVEATNKVATWNEDVTYYEIFDENEQKIAAFFLDPYSRPENKKGGAWMDECIVKGYHNEKLMLPVAYLCCNFTPPSSEQPSLLTFSDVTTMFHEFGHGLQHMLTEVCEVSASGINGVEQDAVEIASQFMENWCYHKETAISMSGHYKTGEKLPEELFDKLLASKNYMVGNFDMRQLYFGNLDLKLHHEFDPNSGKDPHKVVHEIANELLPIPIDPKDRSTCAFGHIFAGGYASGYYSYKWAEIISSDAFASFEDAGLDKQEKIKEVGLKYRKTILGQGGSRHPMDVFKEFKNKEPSIEPYLRHNGIASVS